MWTRQILLPLDSLLAVVTMGVLTFLFLAGLITWRGLRLLRFATLIPLVVCVAYVLRLAAYTVDATQSARQVSEYLATAKDGKMPVAVFKVSRTLEYGLGFYRNRPVARYERDEVPAEDHLLLAAKGREAELALAFVKQRQGQAANGSPKTPMDRQDCDNGPMARDELRPAGEFKPQSIDYYEVRRGVEMPCETQGSRRAPR